MSHTHDRFASASTPSVSVCRMRHGRWAPREQYAAALMEDALGASEDHPAAFAHFVGQMGPEEVSALRKALRNAGRQDRS